VLSIDGIMTTVEKGNTRRGTLPCAISSTASSVRTGQRKNPGLRDENFSSYHLIIRNSYSERSQIFLCLSSSLQSILERRSQKRHFGFLQYYSTFSIHTYPHIRRLTTYANNSQYIMIYSETVVQKEFRRTCSLSV
jgi:hypothetical protein